MSVLRERAAGLSLLRREGTGTPLLLLHGVGSDAETWRAAMEALPPGRAVLAWDAPGYGGSDDLDEAAPDPGAYAARAAALLDALGVARVVAVGHSLGCLFAARLALGHPGRVSGLVLLSPALGHGVAEGGAWPEAVRGRLEELRALGAEAFAERRAPRLVHRPEALPGVRRAMAALRPEGYARALSALARGELMAEAPRLVLPVLVACGAEDGVTPPGGALRLAAALPRALGPARVLPGAGHALPQERPREVAALLEEAAAAAEEDARVG